MRLLASNEDVLALASDSRNVYTGHSWGIAIYSRTGMPIGRVAVGFPVLSLAVSEGAIWAGGSTGLYRIEKESFRISRVASARLTGPIPALELAGDVLWIGGRNLARLNLKTRELHLFAAEELGIEHSWTDWERFLFDGSYVWVDSRDQEPQGPRRFDTATGRWSALSIDSMRLIGLVDGILWAPYNRARPRNNNGAESRPRSSGAVEGIGTLSGGSADARAQAYPGAHGGRAPHILGKL